MEEQDLSKIGRDLLSKIIIFTKYSRYMPHEKRREIYDEIIDRNLKMMIAKYRNKPEVIKYINQAYSMVYSMKGLPSMRALQFSGAAIETCPSRIFNCAALPMDHYKAFSEIMFLLLGGTGVGFSVQKRHVEKLPPINKPTKNRRFLINDTIEGWSDAVKALIEAYLNGKSKPIFDFRSIRAKGTPLKTSGGKAPGPEPLKHCLHVIELMLERKENGEQLRPIEVHDINCHIANAVRAGGIRRAATISLFDMDDNEMLAAKSGDWYISNPQRQLANNSAVILRHKIKEDEFKAFMERVRASGCGEPGFLLSNDPEMLVNPCAEASLRPFTFCNLVEGNAASIESQEDYNEMCRSLSVISTLQSTFTDFHYLRDVWKRNTERDGLIGVSMTGIGSNNLELKGIDVAQGAKIANETNAELAELIGVNPAARCTVLKPAGTTSAVLGTSSGIGSWFAEYFLRRIRIGKDEPIHDYLLKKVPNLIEDDFFDPERQSVLAVPMKAPDGAILSTTEGPIDYLERIKRYYLSWILPGHNRGSNTNNISATVYIGEDEWDKVTSWMWENKDYYTGLSVLPKDNKVYKQMPFEEISKEDYERFLTYLNPIDLTEVIEIDDMTDLTGEAACSGGKCEIL